MHGESRFERWVCAVNALAHAGFVLEETREPAWRLSDDHPWMPFFLATGRRRA